PDTLPLVGSRLGLTRSVLLAFFVGLVRKARRGELPEGAFRPGRVHIAFGLFLAVSFATGVALTPPPGTFSGSIAGCTIFAAHLLLLFCLVAAVRSCGVWWV